MKGQMGRRTRAVGRRTGREGPQVGWWRCVKAWGKLEMRISLKLGTVHSDI
jgi:hypothetical protein